MSTLEYEVKIPDIQNIYRRALVKCHSESPQEYSLGMRIMDVSLAGLGHGPISAVLSDIVDLATAVYTADRACANVANQVRNIRLELPVRDIPCFERSSVQQALKDCLFHFTHDNWEVKFVKRSGAPRPSELQCHYNFDVDPGVPTETALWSGGLDSLLGLLNRAHDAPMTHFTLLGASSSRSVLQQQQRLFRLVNRCANINARLVQIHMDRRRLNGNCNLNSELRTRGFVFLLLGLVTAIVQGQSTLHVYENGIGAFNLPFSDAEVGLDHTRAVHPLSLHKVGLLVSTLVVMRVNIENPFIYATKSEMCEILHAFDDEIRLELIGGTISCDRPRRTRFSQCGVCSSCLLRKFSLLTADIQDPTRYDIPDGKTVTHTDFLHFSAMSQQVQMLSSLLDVEPSWDQFCEKFDLLARLERQRVPVLPTQVLALYRRYVGEWRNAEANLKNDLVRVQPQITRATANPEYIQLPLSTN